MGHRIALASTVAALGVLAPWYARATNYYGYECVATYNTCFGAGSDVPNRCTNAEGFASVMYSHGYSNNASYEGVSVYDSDIIESDKVSGGHDNWYTDTSLGGIWFWSGHGVCGGGVGSYCDNTSLCPPGNGWRCDDLVHVCRQAQDRFNVTCSSSDTFGHFADISTQMWLGESPMTGGWGGAGTNGNMDVVVFDSSCPFEHAFENPLNTRLFAGVHMELGFTGEGGDTGDIGDRGSHFATRITTDSEPVAVGWQDTSRYDTPYGLNGHVCVVAYSCDFAYSQANWRITTETYPWVIDSTSSWSACAETLWCNF